MDRLGVILAGGAARRMGGQDKCLIPLAGARVIDLILDRLAPQVGPVVVSAGGDPARFRGATVVPDPLPGQPGPLAGVLAGLRHAQERGIDQIVTVPGDAPFLPLDLVARLSGAGAHAIAATESASGDIRRHPTFALWSVSAADPLEAWLTAGGHRAARFAEHVGAAVAIWPETRPDPFFNINHPDDLTLAQKLLSP